MIYLFFIFLCLFFTFNIHRTLAEGVHRKTFCHYITIHIWSAPAYPGSWTVTLALLALISASRAAGTSLPARVCNPSSIILYEISCCWLFLINYILCCNTYSRNDAVMIFISKLSLFTLHLVQLSVSQMEEEKRGHVWHHSLISFTIVCLEKHILQI